MKGSVRRKSQLTLLLFIFLFIFTNCSGKYTYINYKKLKRPDKKVKLRSTVFNKFEIYKPSRLGIINNYLVFGDIKADKIIKIVDLKSGEVLKSFGSLGQGPSEFIGISQIIRDPKDGDSFWIFDVTTRNLKKFSINSILKDDFSPKEIVRIQSEKNGFPFHLIFTPDSRILATGYFLKGRISIFDMRGNYIGYIGKHPVKLKNERFAPQHSHGFDGNLVFKDKTKEIYIATRYGSIIEKYSIDGNLISTFYGPERFFPEYDIVPAGPYYTMTYNRKTRFGYLDICYNEKLDRVFLLYSGRYKFNKENKEAVLTNIIYVMDSSDKIVEQIELDKEIFDMEISEDGSTIFGLSYTKIFKFEYKKIK